MERILYTAEAVVEGGRGRTSDSRLEVSLSVPIELGGDIEVNLQVDGVGVNAPQTRHIRQVELRQ